MRRLVGLARRDLLARLEDDFAGLGVGDVVHRLLTAPGLGGVGDLPAVLAAAVDDGLVEGVEDVLAGQAQRVQQRGDRQLALAVDADVDDVLGVEFEVEPTAAVGNDPRGEQIFAAANGSCRGHGRTGRPASGASG